MPGYSLQNGVVKLEETGRIVKGLKRELTLLQPLLESKASEAEGLLKQVCLFSLYHSCEFFNPFPFLQRFKKNVTTAGTN